MVRMAGKAQEDTHEFVVMSLGFLIPPVFLFAVVFWENEESESRWQTSMSCYSEQRTYGC